MYAGNQVLTAKSQKLVELKLNNAALEEQQRSLIQARKDIEKYADLEATAKEVVPQDKDQARSVREIVKIAEESGIKLSSISFPLSSLGSAAPKPSSTATDSSSKVVTPSVSQVKPVEGISGLYVMDISVQSEVGAPVPYSQFIAFLSKLENNRRTAQVSSITVTPNQKDRNSVTFNIVINVYIKQ